MPASEIVIASAKRTPVGSFNGAFGTTAAHDLGAIAIKSALEAAKVEAGDVDEVILGQILTAAEGQNPARQAAMKAGVPQEKTAFSVNQLCGSGLRAVALGLQQIASGDAKIIVAGGQESMSLAPHAAYLRSGVKMGEMKLVDTMLTDGLIDAFHGYHMGNTAENIAKKWQITREEQDRFAVGSQNKAEAAQKAGRFKDEIAPVTISSRKGDVVVDADEYPRAGSTYEAHGEAQARLFQGRIRDRGQRLGPQRRRGRIGHHERRRGQAPGADADGAHRLLGDGGRRSGDHGHRSHSGDPQGAGKGRLVGQGPRACGGQRGLRRAGARGQQGPRAGTRASSTSTAAPLRSAIRSAPRGRAC